MDKSSIDPILQGILEEIEVYQNIDTNLWQEETEYEKLSELLEEEKNFLLKVLLVEKDTSIKEIARNLIKEVDSCDEERESSYIIKRMQEFRIYYYNCVNDEEIIEQVEETLKILIKLRKSVLREKK